MKMYKRIKKGFTLVELVVVIAVIAILAAVSIISYTGITKKARQSKDQQIITEANSALQRSEILKGKPSTAYDALVEAEEGGFKMQNIETATKSYKYAYVKSANRFVVLENNKIVYPEEGFDNIEDLDIWKFSTEQDNLNDGFSHYLKGKKTIDTPISVTGGLDVGENTVSKVSYTRTGASQKATIRTNGGALEINGKNDDVYHYGYAESVNVIDIASSSYHEYGEVKFLEVAAGHINFESTAEVSALHFTVTGTGDDAKFGNDEKTISLDLSKLPEEQYPAFSRDPVTIEENGTYVCEVKTDTTEYIWLFGQGIKEQMVVTSSEGAIATEGTLNSNVTIGAEDGSVAEQIANPAKRNEEGKLIDNSGEVIVISQSDLRTSDGLDGKEVQVETVADKEDVQTGATLFGGGSGTSADPFMIYDYETMQHISTLYSEGYYHYAVNLSKTDNGKIDCAGWKGIDLFGSFDGKNVIFKNLDAPLFNKVNSNVVGGVTLKNFNVDNCLIMTGSYYVGAVLRVAHHDVTMENINISGYLEANSPASFIGQGNMYDTDCTINFIRCHSNMNLVSLNAQAGGFTGNLFGSYYNKNHLCTVNLVDSYFDGSLAVASGTRFSYIQCHTAAPVAYTISYTSQALEDSVSSLYSVGQAEAKDVSYLGSRKTLTKGALTLPSVGSAFTVDKAPNAVSAKAYVIVGLLPGNITGVYVSEELDLSGVSEDTFATSKVKNYEVVVNDGTHNKTEVSGDTLYIYNSNYESGYHGVTFMIVQYDSLNAIVSVSTTSK